MGFPSEQLELTAEISPGADLTADPSTWTWTTLTCTHPSDPSRTISRLMDTPISIRKGVAVGGNQQQTTSATLQLFNHDGALTPELASSPYWPYVDVGTPIRLRMRTTTAVLFQDTFTRTVASGFGTNDSGITYNYYSGTTADLSVNGTTGRISHPSVNVLRMAISNAVYTIRDSDTVFDFSVPALATGAALSIGVQARYQDSLNSLWCSAELLVGGNMQVGVRQQVAGVFTDVAFSGTVGTYSAGVLTRLRVQIVGDRIRMRAWPAASAEPAAWQLDTRQTTFLGAGRHGFLSVTQFGNTNTHPFVFTVDNLTVTQPPYDRVEGYIADIRPVFVPQAGGTTWSTVMVDVGGIGILTEKQQAPSFSPMRRSVQEATEIPVAYWPLEDDDGSTFAVSAFPGGPQMSVVGPAVFGFSSGIPTEQYLSRYGTKPMVSVAAGARLSGVVPQSAVVTEWAVSVIGDFFAPGVSPPLAEMRIVQWDTPSGTHNRWALIASGTLGYVVRAYNDALGTTTDVVTYSAASFVRSTYTVEGHQTGGNVFAELFINDISIASGTVASTQAPITRLTINPDRVNTTASTDPYGIRFVVGHARVLDEITAHDTPHYTVVETGVTVTSSTAWYQEPAHRRLERLCQEERVPFQYRGTPGTTGMTLLNAQQDGTFTSLTGAAVEAESGGLLYEHRFGYEYLPRSVRYNQAAKLVINMATYAYADSTDSGDVLVPQLDSRATNYWTVTRTNGASGSWAADAAYRKRRGTIAEERTLDVLTDDVTTDHAAWRVHLGVDGVGANYPSVLLDLAANPGLIDAWLYCLLGDRVQRTNQPTIAGVGTIDQVLVGTVETISPTSWEVVAAVTAATVWDVGVWDDGVSRYAPYATTLSSGITTTALSLTMAGEPWTTGAVATLLEVDGEQMLTSNISGSGSGPYTVTLSARSVNGVVKAHLTGAPVNLANPVHWAL